MKKLEQYPLSELKAMSEILDSVNSQMSEFYGHIEQTLKKEEIDSVIAEEIKLSLNHKFQVNTKKIFEIQDEIVSKMKNRLGACVMPKDLNNLTERFNKSVNEYIIEKEKKSAENKTEDLKKPEKDVVKLDNRRNNKKSETIKKTVD